MRHLLLQPLTQQQTLLLLLLLLLVAVKVSSWRPCLRWLAGRLVWTCCRQINRQQQQQQ
jgi:hypothetical protein